MVLSIKIANFAEDKLQYPKHKLHDMQTKGCKSLKDLVSLS